MRDRHQTKPTQSGRLRLITWPARQTSAPWPLIPPTDPRPIRRFRPAYFYLAFTESLANVSRHETKSVSDTRLRLYPCVGRQINRPCRLTTRYGLKTVLEPKKRNTNETPNPALSKLSFRLQKIIRREQRIRSGHLLPTEHYMLTEAR
jgi:hypothetical protein